MYTYDARIRYSEADCENKLTPESLLDYFQDCSTFQSEDLGLGVKYMLEHQLVWALSSWQIDVEKYPEIGERVKIGTLPYAFKGFIGFRNFWMDDSQGRRLAIANSIWTLLDLKTGKPARPLPEMLEGYRISPKLEMEYLPRKIAVPRRAEEKTETSSRDGDNDMDMEQSGCGIKCFDKPEFVITRHYLDTNHHVNNGQYVKMALEYVEDGFAIRRLRAEYKKQAYLGDVFCPVVYQDGNIYTVSLNSKEGEPYAVVELTGTGK